MKVPPGFDLGESDEITLNAAELGWLKASIRRIQDDRDQARAWAAYHHADANHERHRLHLLMTFGRTPRERAEEIMGPHLSDPEDLADKASDGWIGMLTDTSILAAARTTL